MIAVQNPTMPNLTLELDLSATSISQQAAPTTKPKPKDPAPTRETPPGKEAPDAPPTPFSPPSTPEPERTCPLDPTRKYPTCGK